MPVTYPHITVRIEREQYERLKRQADKQRKHITELARTYIEWGLENDSCASSD
jgi:hypothetical protein